jgi:hypothetical protein
MKRALVVYESMFGNTRTIAEAVADGLASDAIVEVVEVGTAPTVLAGQVDLLVVGGPTHAFGMSRPATREDATRQAGGRVVSAGIGLREWLETLPRGDGSVAVTTFDTRIDHPRLPGSAARKAEKRLRHLGYPVVAKAESFSVSGTQGPLVDGEIDRARGWGRALGAQVGERPSVTARRG